MKRIVYSFMAFGLFVFVESCKKSNSNSGLSALNIIQATIGIPAIYVYFTNSDSAYYRQQAILPFATSAEYGLASNSSIVLISMGDTTKTLLRTTLNLMPGAIYSLYLAGNATNMDTLLLQDFIPSYADSSAGARFVNLVENSRPVSINLAENDPGQTEFTILGYKQVSPFKAYPATASIGGRYHFEVRDQRTQSLLTTFSWNYTTSKNNTLAIIGSVNTGVNVFQINNY